MKITEKEKEDEGNWPNYTLENGWRIVIERRHAAQFRAKVRYYLVSNQKDIVFREPEGGWYAMNNTKTRAMRFSCRRDAVVAYIAQRM
jgi:hypothetical protein